MRMSTRLCWMIPIASCIILSAAGCNEYSPMTTNQAAGSVEQQFDTRQVDVSGDGDRARLSGYNNINNPPVDLRTLPRAHAASPYVTNGRYAGNALADRAAGLTLSIPNVSSAAAIASGRVIIIGLGIRHAVVQPDTLAIKKEVRRRILTQAPVFRYVYVTTDRNQLTQINQIADGLRNGNPLSIYTSRIHNLMDTMKPVPWG